MKLVVFGIHDWQVEGKLRCNGLVLRHPSLHRWNERERERERPHRIALDSSTTRVFRPTPSKCDGEDCDPGLHRFNKRKRPTTSCWIDRRRVCFAYRSEQMRWIRSVESSVALLQQQTKRMRPHDVSEL
eukprot:CAMPEP_0172357356 /NCGR_PEP_ID=MMETSP1060-20121228/1757_1 /TAXON_ID=37318 /ORGANISM="Pseudo-nitzschia pungens, Strain cf. cingulata" /LENGTH=128 /DNA_ID=CAMNT_0013078025 /DNA_START=842 /DNA_END=1224 /DNA_ORIENTATION=-